MTCYRPPTVILADPEPLVLLPVALALDDSGYRVLQARTIEQLRELLVQGGDCFALICDEAIGSLSEIASLFENIRDQRPEIGIVMTSAGAHIAPLNLPAGCRFLAKPFGTETLVQALLSASSGTDFPPAAL